jgi:G:T-mismatch repair DNA endonuclease (very short patch repair protein)
LSGGRGVPLLDSDNVILSTIKYKLKNSNKMEKNKINKKKIWGKPFLKGYIPWNKNIKMWSEKQKKEMSGVNSNSSKYLKNKTYKEIYGIEGAKKQKEKREKHYKYLRQSATIDLKGKTYEEIYGQEKAKEQKIKSKIKTQQHYDNGTATFGFPKDGTMKIKRANQIFPMQDTKIEIKIQNYLKELKIGFFTHYYCKEISHAYQCDIFIPVQKNRDRFIQQPIILECDGDYWHGNINHLRYKILTENQKEQIEEDEIRTQELEAKGFRVIRLWETDINKLDLNDFNKICCNQNKTTI